MKKIIINFYLSYIKFFAKLRLRIVNPTIIGIGGASGKSSLTNLVTIVLSQKYKVHGSGGKNSETGIPLDILGINIDKYSYSFWAKSALLAPIKVFVNKKNFDFYVVEMGIDSPHSPKNMSYLLSIVKPNIGVLTNISIEHSVYFDELVNGSFEKNRKEKILDYIAKEESLLLTTLDEKSKAVINLDDRRIKELLPLKTNILKISKSRENTDFKIENTEVGINSFKLSFIFLKENYTINLNQTLPKYYSHTLMIAVATCFSAGMSIKNIIAIIEKNFTLPPGRFSVFVGIKDSIVIDSSYNSSLESSVGALELLNEIGKDKRKVAVLGDMRELGSLSKIQHENLAKEIVKNLDFVILIGPQMRKYIVPILKKSKFNHLSYLSFDNAKNNISKNIKEKDIILVKSSQNELFLERVVELLLKNNIDKEKLARRGEFWDRKRKESN